ncbi:MAG: cobalamin B12-binding domain-containing protein [Planctomycetes bacterium]|nr:cobalamin B12-binding domain-containing protein [Planctomycetota bacterium]
MASTESSSVSAQRPFRVLVAKAGLDGHDRGAKVVAASLRDAGVEVIYTGLRQTPEMIVHAALQEDADAVGLSSLSGAHMTLFARVFELLKESKADSILLFGGGVMPQPDIDKLTQLGVGRIFGPGTDTRDILKYLNDEIPKRRATQEV